MQYAFKKEAGAEQPLTLLKLLSEEAFEKRRSFLAFSQDISKAYDNVERHLAVEMALRRLGVPEDVIQIYMEVQRGNMVDMLTAYGKSSDILGESGTFESLRGLAQGGSECPMLWVAVYDILIAMQEEAAEEHSPVTVGERGEHKVVGWAFADDAIWVATDKEGLNHRCTISDLYFTFFGLQFNTKKSYGVGVEWFGTRYKCAQKLGYIPAIYNSDDYFGEELTPGRCRIAQRTKMATLEEGVLYLGVQWSPMPHAVDHAYIKKLQAQVKDAVTRIKSMALRPGSIWYLLEAKLWSSIKWRIQYKVFTSAQLDELEKPARHLAITGAGLTKSLSRNLVHASAERGGLGWHRWRDRVMAQRLLMTTTMLRTGGLLGSAITEALLRTQEKAGGTTNPLQDPSLAGWGGPGGTPGMMDELAIWMAQHGLRLQEKERHDLREQGIAALFAGTPHERKIREFCYLTDKRYVYQLLKEDGRTLCEHQFKDAAGKTPECAQEIRIRLGESGVGRGTQVAPQYHCCSDSMLNADKAQVGDSVLVRNTAGYRVGQMQSGGWTGRVCWYDKLIPSRPRQGEVRVFTQGDWEEAKILPAPRIRQTQTRAQLRSYSPQYRPSVCFFTLKL